MYRKMDQKERTLYLLPVCGLICSIAFLFGIMNQYWYLSGDIVCLCVFLMATMGIRYRKLSQEIMPLAGCFLEIRKDCILVRQPQRKERYESCQIFYSEIESIVWSNIKDGFYIQFCDSGKSSVLLHGVQSKPVFHIRSFGYRKEELESVYQAIKERIPSSAVVFEP